MGGTPGSPRPEPSQFFTQSLQCWCQNCVDINIGQNLGLQYWQFRKQDHVGQRVHPSKRGGGGICFWYSSCTENPRSVIELIHRGGPILARGNFSILGLTARTFPQTFCYQLKENHRCVDSTEIKEEKESKPPVLSAPRNLTTCNFPQRNSRCLSAPSLPIDPQGCQPGQTS